MNRLPAKQIYLLSIIVIGILTLSVYSTYSIYTLESETSDIVSMQTSNYLDINTKTYEYSKITIPANKLNNIITTIISKTPSLNILFFPSLLIGISPFLILLFILKALKVLSIASFRFLRKV